LGRAAQELEMTTMKRLYDLTGKVALITGGSRGIGLQMAEGLGEMGARLVISARKAEQLDTAVTHLTGLGIEAKAVVADLARSESIKPLVDQAIAAFGGLDILINNAGSSWMAAAEDYPDEAWAKVIHLSVNAPFMLSREIAKRTLIPQRSGKIINISSIAGFRGNTTGQAGGGHLVAYHTGKGAMLNMTRALAVEWGGYNINVNCICPGYFQTRLSEGLLARISDSVVEATPLRRIGGSDDIKGVAAFLCSAAARHISGQIIAVDGGYSAG
jgi:NAD(P)-dependent dehydrogenase (short-subunit alcohol dehydrogenase family)